VKDFDVDCALLCDYVSQGVDGKQTLAGVIGGELVFAQQPPIWFPLYVCISLIPKRSRVEFVGRFVDHRGEPVISVSGVAEEHSGQTDRLRFHRLNLNFQLPPVKFAGAGVYNIEAFTKSSPKDKFTRAINVVVGQHPGTLPWTMNAEPAITQPLFFGSKNTSNYSNSGSV
jgi:hypothetical protein